MTEKEKQDLENIKRLNEQISNIPEEFNQEPKKEIEKAKEEAKEKAKEVENAKKPQDNLNELFNQLEKSEAKDLEVVKDNSTRNTLIAIFAGILILTILAFMYLYWKSDSTTSSKTGVDVTISGDNGSKATEDNRDRDEDEEEIENTENDEDSESEEDESTDTGVKPKNTKVKLEDWEKVSKDNMTEQQKETMLQNAEQGPIGEMFVGMPSEAEGFTSDKEKMLDENYLPNPYYVDLTKEEFIEQYTDILMRVTSPVYGNWVGLQLESSKKIDTRDYYNTIFKGVSDGELSENTKPDERSPLMFDYDGNGFAGIYDKKQVDKNGARIVGRLKKGQLIYDSETRMKSDITVTYYLPDGSTFDRDMVLDLKINDDNRLVITKITGK